MTQRLRFCTDLRRIRSPRLLLMCKRKRMVEKVLDHRTFSHSKAKPFPKSNSDSLLKQEGGNEVLKSTFLPGKSFFPSFVAPVPTGSPNSVLEKVLCFRAAKGSIAQHFFNYLVLLSFLYGPAAGHCSLLQRRRFLNPYTFRHSLRHTLNVRFPPVRGARCPQLELPRVRTAHALLHHVVVSASLTVDGAARWPRGSAGACRAPRMPTFDATADCSSTSPRYGG